jgi:hypothetical protein
LEQRLQEREGLVDIKLGRELEALAIHESNLDSHEATLEVEEKVLEDAHLMVTTCELAADVREAELAKWEKRLAERQLQESLGLLKRGWRSSRRGESTTSWARPRPL